MNNSIQSAAQQDFKEMQKRVLEETNMIQEKIKEIESMTAKVKQEGIFEQPFYPYELPVKRTYQEANSLAYKHQSQIQ